MLGAFAGYGVLTALGGPLNPALPIGLVILLMLLAGMAASGATGVIIERVAYRPLRTAPRIAPLISALGVSFFLQNSALLLFGADFRSYNTFELGDGVLFTSGIHAGPLNISLIRIVIIGATVALCIGLTLFVSRSKIGKAMRATSFDREAASMMGINVDRTIVVTFLIGSLLAGAAGVMVGLVFQKIFHLMGFAIGLKAFTAAVVGGIGSIPGAMVGGLIIGIAEALAIGYLPQGSTFQDLWVFAILIIVLLVRPQGLFGKPDIKKV
jgi:branched-chain amino acid transport system permease protein